MAKKTRIKTNITPQIITREDAERALSDLQLITINEQKILAQKNKRLAEIEAQYAPDLAEIAAAREDHAAMVQLWAEQNPAAFEKKKSIEWPAGRFGFRTGNPQVVLLNRKWNLKTVLAAIKTSLPNFVRTKEEVDKDAILADYAKDPALQPTLAAVGLKVTQDESFFIEPALEEVEPRHTNTTPIEQEAA